MNGKESAVDVQNIMKGVGIGMLALSALWVGAQFNPIVWPLSPQDSMRRAA